MITTKTTTTELPLIDTANLDEVTGGCGRPRPALRAARLEFRAARLEARAQRIHNRLGG